MRSAPREQPTGTASVLVDPGSVGGPWTFVPGDKVMQIENDYDKEVYNGDIGYVDDIDPDAGEAGDVGRFIKRHADDRELAEQGAGGGGRGVVAAEVDAIGLGAEGDLRRIVHHEDRAEVTAEFGDGRGLGDPDFRRQTLRA